MKLTVAFCNFTNASNKNGRNRASIALRSEVITDVTLKTRQDAVCTANGSATPWRGPLSVKDKTPYILLTVQQPLGGDRCPNPQNLGSVNRHFFSHNE